MNKPIVTFKDLEFCEVGYGAMVWPINHPSLLRTQKVSNNKWNQTSTVLTKEIDGLDRVIRFETMNTIYVRQGYEPANAAPTCSERGCEEHTSSQVGCCSVQEGQANKSGA